MNNKLYQYILGGILLLSSFSCNSYLDVKPVDKFLESQVFSTEQGTYNAVNGIYLNLINDRSYGRDLTMGTLDVMGQLYNMPSSEHTYYSYSRYEYDNEGVRNRFDGIWTGAYVNILNINVALEAMEDYKGTLPDQKHKWLKGELYGLRAMLHFDLFRIFGPMPSDFVQESLPYYTKVEKNAVGLIDGESFLAQVISDLNTAEGLLEDDPVITEGVVIPDDSEVLDFFMFRNYRMNYYAVKALQARVNLYAGNNQSALDAAEVVINEASTIFPWTDPFDVISNPEAPNTIFSTEVILGTQNLQLIQDYNATFQSTLAEKNILAPRSNRLTQVFEGNEGDYRFNSCWEDSGNKSYRTFAKFQVPSAYDYLIPLIRMSEMYYIAAEVLMESDQMQSLAYLNTVRFNRGLTDLDENADIEDELLKEYQREFYGEGQLFYFYKRNEFGSIEDGASSSANISMNPSTYVVPLPISEVQYRNN